LVISVRNLFRLQMLNLSTDQQARDKALKEHLIQMKTWMKRIEDGVDRLGSKLKDLWKSVES
jgi:hypothetical protein